MVRNIWQEWSAFGIVHLLYVDNEKRIIDCSEMYSIHKSTMSFADIKLNAGDPVTLVSFRKESLTLTLPAIEGKFRLPIVLVCDLSESKSKSIEDLGGPDEAVRTLSNSFDRTTVAADDE